MIVDSPLVTVCIPVYNESKNLASTIENIINQDYMNLEILISDNDSTDDSFDIAQSYVDKDNRIKLKRLDKNIGASSNIQEMVNEGSGKYCMLVGAHDLRQHNMISSCVSIMEERKSISIVHPKAMWIDGTGKVIDEINASLSTVGIKSPIARVATTLFAHGYGSVVYGLMRYSDLKKINIGARIIAADILWMAEMSCYGEIYYDDSVTLYCRHNSEVAGDWGKYIERIYGCDLDTLEPEKVTFDMHEAFQRCLKRHFSSEEDQLMVSAITSMALNTRYKNIPAICLKIMGRQAKNNNAWNDALVDIDKILANYLSDFKS